MFKTNAKIKIAKTSNKIDRCKIRYLLKITVKV